MEFKGTPFIIAAKSHDDGRDGGIFVWKKESSLVASEQKMNWWWILQTVMILVSAAFICQNLGISNSIPLLRRGTIHFSGAST